uniref:Uncharacterized protein n=1 Tax=Aegilops tauschii TaxID=37682 RepID=M8CKY2_AEGTA
MLMSIPNPRFPKGLERLKKIFCNSFDCRLLERNDILSSSSSPPSWDMPKSPEPLPFIDDDARLPPEALPGPFSSSSSSGSM